MSELLTAEQARDIASKADLNDWLLGCILKRINMIAEKGGVSLKFVLKWGDEFDYNDLMDFKKGIDDKFELFATEVMRRAREQTELRIKIENLGYKIDADTWQSGYHAGGESIVIEWGI